MAILQISKIQQRSGNLVDLPQLDEAEFGWASDAKRLFIGKITPNENVEVLTAYSNISFSQIDGAVGNLNITALSAANGQVLAFDGTNWVNRGGNAGGLLTLGDVSNVQITGGATGYVLQTDGTGNLSWTPKATIIANIQSVTQANPAVVTTIGNNYFTEGARVTITNAQGMTQLNGNAYYANVISSNSFSLYSDSGLSTPINSTGYNAYAYTSVTGTTVSTNRVTVGNSAPFTANAAVTFIGSLSTSGIVANTTYYVYDAPTSTTLRIATSADGNASNILSLQTTTGLTANVYQQGGRIISNVGGANGFGVASGANTQVQYNSGGLLAGDSDFAYNFGVSPKVLTLNANANVGNLNATGIVTGTRLVSNVANGTTPIQVTSVTRVPNLNVSYSNVSDYGNVVAQSSGTFYPVFVSGNTSGNYQLGSNANISFNAATGLFTVPALTVAANATISGNVIANSIITAAGSSSNLTINPDGTGDVIFTPNTELVIQSGAVSTSTTTGALQILGGIGLNGNIYAGGLINVVGNANVGNLGTAGLVTATGNITGGNITTAGQVTATGNITGGNLISSGILNVTGNANAGNLGATQVLASVDMVAPQFISNITTGTAPFIVNSTTRVANLNVARANTSDYVGISSTGTGTIYPVFVGGNTTGNYTLSSNSAISFNASTGILSANGLIANGNITGNNLTISNNANIQAALRVANDAVINGNANVGLALNLTGDLVGSGNANILGTIKTTSNAIANNISIGYFANVGANLLVSGNAIIAGDTTIGGNANISGNISTNRLTSIGNASVGGILTVTGNTNMTGNANVSSNLNVTGNTILGGNVTVLGTLSINTSLIVPANLSSNNLNVSSQATVGNTLTVVGNIDTYSNANIGANLIVLGNANIASNVSIGGNIGVFNANIGGNANVIGNLSINGIANVTGVTNLSGILNVSQETSVGGNISSSRNISAGGNITVGGNINIASNSFAANSTVYSTLSVGGNTTIGGSTTVQGNLNVTGSATSNFAGNLGINGNLNVTGTANVSNLNSTGNAIFQNATAATSIFGTLKDNFGYPITKIDNDSTMAANSANYLATQQAIVTYIQNALNAINASTIPVGTVFWRAANIAPSGYLIADGSLVSTTTYANLFAVIGYAYGGTGSSFAIPDLRGQFIRGIDNGRGVDPSRGFGTTQTDAFQGHYHVPLTNQTTFWGDASGGPQQGRPTGGGGYYLNRTTGSPVSDGSNGIPRTASETRPINVALLPIIKY
jgi:hypothetical protein